MGATMSKNNFSAMTDDRLRAYVLSHRQDTAAFDFEQF
jgi:hypothetical protein